MRKSSGTKRRPRTAPPTDEVRPAGHEPPEFLSDDDRFESVVDICSADSFPASDPPGYLPLGHD